MIFNRGGRKNKDKFHYKGEAVEIVNSYTYLGVPFFTSGTFASTTEYFKGKGKKALGSLWSIIFKGRVFHWHTHKQLFDSVVKATTLYGSHIWCLNYLAEIEKVQTEFLKKLFYINRTAGNFSTKLEMGVVKLQMEVMQRAIFFLDKVSSLPECRYATVIFPTLKQKHIAHPNKSIIG